MSSDSQRVAVGIGEADSDPPPRSTRVGCDPELERIMKECAAEVERIVARRKPELIQQGIEAYKRDLPRLLAENRYRQQVAYRGNELIAFAATTRQLWKKLEKLGFSDMGELFMTVVEPPEIDEDDEVRSEDPSSDMHSTRVESDPEPDRLFKEREAVLDRILAQRKPELIQQGYETYLRDLPRLLAEDRYLQRVAYRGNEMVAIAPTGRKLWKKLEKLGLTDRGEIFETVVEPLDIDEGDEIQSEGSSSGPSQP